MSTESDGRRSASEQEEASSNIAKALDIESSESSESWATELVVEEGKMDVGIESKANVLGSYINTFEIFSTVR